MMRSTTPAIMLLTMWFATLFQVLLLLQPMTTVEAFNIVIMSHRPKPESELLDDGACQCLPTASDGPEEEWKPCQWDFGDENGEIKTECYEYAFDEATAEIENGGNRCAPFMRNC